MERCINTSSVILFLCLVVLWAGCAGPSTEPIETSAEVTTSIEMATTTDETTTMAESTGIPVPDWFLNIPEDPGYLYAVATASSKSMDMALDTARHASRTDLAGQISTKVQSLFKRFREEVGAGEDSELTAMTTAVSKEIVSELLTGAKPVKQDLSKEGSLYHAYVLSEMSVGAVNSTVVDQTKENRNMYTRFRASQGFKELEAEVEKYEKYKEEQAAQ